MLKRHEVQVLLKAGHSSPEVAKLTGVSEREVRRIRDEPAVQHVDDDAERRLRGIGRPSKVERFRKFLVDALAKEPELLSLELLRRAREAGYDGAKTAFYSLAASLRPPKTTPVVRFEGLPGEFSQHDFGHVDVRFIDDHVERVHFFASRLKYSRWVEVTIVPNERVEPLCRTLLTHFEAFGGVPLMAVFDRPKTVVLSWRKNGDVTEWNSTFAQVMLELSVAPEVCWPRSGWQKGAVENLVGWVKGSFFKQRRFHDEADLRQQLRDWVTEVNTRTPSRATSVIPAKAMESERPRLRPLKVTSERLALRFPVFVGPTAYVEHDTRSYSMPPESIGIAGTLFLFPLVVTIHAGRFSVDHPRLMSPHTKSTLPEHRDAHVAAVAGKRGKLYLRRQQILDLGQLVVDYLTELVHRRPRDWSRDIERMHELLQKHGEPAMKEAIALAFDAETYGAEYVAHHLRARAGGSGSLWTPTLPTSIAPATTSVQQPDVRSGAKPRQLKLPLKGTP